MNNAIKSDLSLSKNWQIAGLISTPIRWVLGWVFFSAFWRRVVLAPAKVDPNSAAYVGHKFNHFLPNALWIKPMLNSLLLNPNALYGFLIAFTIIEGLVGLSMFFGLGTRLGALGVTLLSWGILLGSGWLGTTCLDEWQIGVLGIAGGLTVLLTGAGPWSLDHFWQSRWPDLAQSRLLRWLSSGPLWSEQSSPPSGLAFVGALAVFAIGITLYTNQAFAGGVWGKLHNPSKKPHITLSQPVLDQKGDLQLTMYRDGGPDTYGAFVTAVTVENSSGKPVLTFDSQQLCNLPSSAIENRYPVKIHPGAESLEVPLGSEARIQLDPKTPSNLSPGKYIVNVTDISGAEWSIPVTVQ
jgi:thiosulfate dehydrogenase (quinone)